MTTTASANANAAVSVHRANGGAVLFAKPTARRPLRGERRALRRLLGKPEEAEEESGSEEESLQRLRVVRGLRVFGESRRRPPPAGARCLRRREYFLSSPSRDEEEALLPEEEKAALRLCRRFQRGEALLPLRLPVLPFPWGGNLSCEASDEEAGGDVFSGEDGGRPCETRRRTRSRISSTASRGQSKPDKSRGAAGVSGWFGGKRMGARSDEGGATGSLDFKNKLAAALCDGGTLGRRPGSPTLAENKPTSLEGPPLLLATASMSSVKGFRSFSVAALATRWENPSPPNAVSRGCNKAGHSTPKAEAALRVVCAEFSPVNGSVIRPSSAPPTPAERLSPLCARRLATADLSLRAKVVRAATRRATCDFFAASASSLSSLLFVGGGAVLGSVLHGWGAA